MILVLSFSAAGTIVVLLLVRHYNLERVAGDWAFFDVADWDHEVRALTAVVENDRFLAEDALRATDDARARKDESAACHMAGLGVRLVQDAAPERIAHLDRMSRLSRMAAAISPPLPVWPGLFRQRRVAWLAWAGLALQALVVAGDEMFRIRTSVLAWSYRLTAHAIGSVPAWLRREPEMARAWTRFRDGLADFLTLGDEHVGTARALAVSRRAVRRA